jgi:7SK snRNA methylphosphate capping enzyme
LGLQKDPYFHAPTPTNIKEPKQIKNIEKTNNEEQTPDLKTTNGYIHGNYPSYYGYRSANTRVDNRMTFFQKEWFEGKNVLDIGCNAGQITLNIALHFNPVNIEGIFLFNIRRCRYRS